MTQAELAELKAKIARIDSQLDCDLYAEAQREYTAALEEIAEDWFAESSP